MCSGGLLSVRGSSRTEGSVRLLLFAAAPVTYIGSHFLLLDVHASEIGGQLSSVLTFATSTPRLLAYAVTVGVPFGLIFGTLQCLPARLFGRRDLPSIQSATYSAILLSAATFGPLGSNPRSNSGMGHGTGTQR